MYRREFIRNSSMVVGAVVIGLPNFAVLLNKRRPVCRTLPSATDGTQAARLCPHA